MTNITPVDCLSSGLSDLRLSDQLKIEQEQTKVDSFLSTVHNKIKTAACIVSIGQFEVRSVSGWSSTNLNWNNHEILSQWHMTKRVRKLTADMGFKLSPGDRDGLDFAGYFPGRYHACHAEPQLMAWVIDQYCPAQRSKTTGKRYRRIDLLNETVVIHVSREVCEQCHRLARQALWFTGIEFVFQQPHTVNSLYPKCAFCDNETPRGYVCANCQNGNKGVHAWCESLLREIKMVSRGVRKNRKIREDENIAERCTALKVAAKQQRARIEGLTRDTAKVLAECRSFRMELEKRTKMNECEGKTGASRDTNTDFSNLLEPATTRLDTGLKELRL